MSEKERVIDVQNLDCGYGSNLILRDLSFSLSRGEIFAVVGPSGCGKSTLLKNMIGLYEPFRGAIRYFGKDFLEVGEVERRELLRNMGVLYQSSALFSAMTVAENVALPLQEYTKLKKDRVAELVSLKLELVNLGGFEDRFPSALSGGMKKRAGLARAMALDPPILFFDEPSAGLDPLTSRNLDQLILRIRASFDTTVFVVSHELESIFTIADRVMVLDPKEKTAIAIGSPRELAESNDPRVRDFMTRAGDLMERQKN